MNDPAVREKFIKNQVDLSSSDGSDEDQEANEVLGFKGAPAAQNRYS